LIREINHRIGNQLQILSSIVSIESRKAISDEAIAVLSRLRQTLDKMGEEHSALRSCDYLAIAEINSAFLSAVSASG
jgi:two-component sensor histidine kinase